MLFHRNLSEICAAVTLLVSVWRDLMLRFSQTTQDAEKNKYRGLYTKRLKWGTGT